MTPDAPKLRINPESIVGLDRWLVAIRNVQTKETMLQLVERRTLGDPERNIPVGTTVLAHIMISDKDWCAVGEWIAINLWSGDPAETGQDDGPVIVTGAAATDP